MEYAIHGRRDVHRQGGVPLTDEERPLHRAHVSVVCQPARCLHIGRVAPNDLCKVSTRLSNDLAIS